MKKINFLTCARVGNAKRADMKRLTYCWGVAITAISLASVGIAADDEEKKAAKKPTAQEREILAAEKLLDGLSSTNKGRLTKLLNSGTAKELAALPGIGKITAAAIVKARPLESSAHLVTVKSVGLKTMEKIVAFVDGGGLSAAAEKSGGEKEASKTKAKPGKVNLNTATVAELDALPGIGESTAKKIIAGRPYKSLDDLEKVDGIGKSAIGKLKNLVEVK